MRYPWTAFLLALRAGLRDLRFWGVFLLALAAGGVLPLASLSALGLSLAVRSFAELPMGSLSPGDVGSLAG